MLKAKDCTVFSGGASGTEEYFGILAEEYGVNEVNYSFEGHQSTRNRGVKFLSPEELTLKDVSLTYVSKLMNREYTQAPLFRKLLQSICWQVSSGHEVFVVGTILDDLTVKGGTGWGAEYAKICNKPLFVFDQEKNSWFKWQREAWFSIEPPVINNKEFTATGTRFLNDSGKKAIKELFSRSFNK